MSEVDVEKLLKDVANKEITLEQALSICRTLPTHIVLQDLNLDTHRRVRTGINEVVFAQGKSNEQLRSAVSGFFDYHPVLVTKLNGEQGHFLAKHFIDGLFWEDAGIFTLGKHIPINPPYPQKGEVVIISAGAADRSIALEAFATLCFWDINAAFISDVGVAGLHRLQNHISTIMDARIIIVVAGMEGALPSVIGGFAPCPIIAVPTSIGYGVGLGGNVALSAMLCSCAPGIATVNIDNGFGAAAFATKFMNILKA